MSPVPVWIACAMLGLVSAGCGHSDAASPGESQVSLPAKLDGGKVATMAERELESENPAMARGRMHCPDLTLAVEASVRCQRVARLTEGRVVKVLGTVAVTSLASGGRLHVVMDADAEQFGVSGGHLAADVRERYRTVSGDHATQVRCPYLAGRVGATVTCRVSVAGERRDVKVLVTAVDAEDYRTTYTIDAGEAAS